MLISSLGTKDIKIQKKQSYNKEKEIFREGQAEYTTTNDMKPILAHDI
jgi:hypothetical protein